MQRFKLDGAPAGDLQVLLWNETAAASGSQLGSCSIKVGDLLGSKAPQMSCQIMHNGKVAGSIRVRHSFKVDASQKSESVVKTSAVAKGGAGKLKAGYPGRSTGGIRGLKAGKTRSGQQYGMVEREVLTYREQLERCEQSGQKFLDSDFPPEKCSLITDWEEDHEEVAEAINDHKWD